MIRIKISKALEGKIRKGYPWIFYYQVQNKHVEGKSGDLGVVYDCKNRFLAIGLYDPESDIRLRVLEVRHPIDIDGDFFEKRIIQALKLRESILNEDTTGYRLINGENDGFPGLVLDRYESTIVLKLYTSAWVSYLDILVPLFKKFFSVDRCVLRWSRKVIELPETTKKYKEGQILFGEKVELPIRFKENGVKFEADVILGQKTGFYLDQRDNREQVRSLSNGKSILNVFSYTGAFTVYAFSGGACSVLEVDSNSFALAASKKNLRLNFKNRKFSLEEFSQVKANAFDALLELERNSQKFDLVILDPPAFAKRKKQKATALKAYMRLVQAGAKVTKKGGILFAASCSVHVEAANFYKAVFSGILSTGRKYVEINRTGHGKDHPIKFSEGEYLKGVFCKITL